MARVLIGNIRGPQGERGAQGERGPQGLRGEPGATPALTNNALATVAGVSALDAVMGKTLNDKIEFIDVSAATSLSAAVQITNQKIIKNSKLVDMLIEFRVVGTVPAKTDIIQLPVIIAHACDIHAALSYFPDNRIAFTAYSNKLQPSVEIKDSIFRLTFMTTIA